MLKIGVTYSRLAGHNSTRLNRTRHPGCGKFTKAVIYGGVFVSHEHRTLQIGEKAQLIPYLLISDVDDTLS